MLYSYSTVYSAQYYSIPLPTAFSCILHPYVQQGVNPLAVIQLNCAVYPAVTRRMYLTISKKGLFNKKFMLCSQKHTPAAGSQQGSAEAGAGEGLHKETHSGTNEPASALLRAGYG